MRDCVALTWVWESRVHCLACILHICFPSLPEGLMFCIYRPPHSLCALSAALVCPLADNIFHPSANPGCSWTCWARVCQWSHPLEVCVRVPVSPLYEMEKWQRWKGGWDARKLKPCQPTGCTDTSEISVAKRFWCSVIPSFTRSPWSLCQLFTWYCKLTGLGLNCQR